MSDTPFLRITALSHLAWERTLFQRPQQLMSRFAALGHRVDYFSLVSFKRYLAMPLEARLIKGPGDLEAQNLPFFPGTSRFALSAWLSRKLLTLKARPTLRAGTAPRVLWLQYPGFVDLVDQLPHDLLVYDAMDPFRAFAKSDPKVLRQEEELLQRANIVFTGGRSLQRLLEPLRPNAICHPSGIDFNHFARAAQECPAPPPDIAKLSKPVLGYFGAVDERLDWDLLQYLCRERRHWSIVLIGPLVGLDKLPINEPNLHWLGPKSYARLPDYLRCFDVCLIPWKVNDLTRFMSPTKTPEYLASGRPVVSVPIPDVAADYAEEVLLADTPKAFLEQCTKALLRGKGPALKPPQSRTWDEIAEAMLGTIAAAVTG